MRRSFPLTLLAAMAALAACDSNSTAPELAETPATLAAAAGSWSTRAPYPRSEWGAASAAVTNSSTLRSILYVIGGKPPFTGAGQVTDAVKAYDVQANVWRSKAHYPVRVWLTHGAVEIGGRIYVTGGTSRRFDEEKQAYVGQVIPSLYVYDPSADRWSQRADLPILASGRGISATYQGKLYVATSCIDSAICGGDTDRGALWRYNPANDHWVLLTRTPHDPSNGGGGFIGGKLYLMSEAGRQATDVYTVATNTWSSGPPRPGSEICVPAYETAQAKLFLTCPASDGGTTLAVLNPETGWSSTAPIPGGAGGTAYSLSRVVRSGTTRLELVGGEVPSNNLQFTP